MARTILCAFCCAAWSLPALAADDAARPRAIDKPLLAYWTFDDTVTGRCTDTSGNGCEAVLDRPGAAVERVPGIFGTAARFSGSHKLQVRQIPCLDTLPAISFSAWVQPEQLGGYREIFRKEDKDRRLLFSFQNDGTILSLGLNIGGYVECDARIDPHAVLDGRWHHCAASFDGQTMRVYLDGAEVGSLPRPGTILAGGPARAYIGSSSGNECFQGAMDELRIYRAALTAEEVAALFLNGRGTVDRQARLLAEHLGKIYVKRETLAATLAGCRQYLAEQGLRLDKKLAGPLLARLKGDFPDDFALLAECAESDLSECLAADGDFVARLAGRVVELMLEYKPLTDAQWQKQSPDQRRQWREAEAIQARYQRLSSGLSRSERNTQECIELILEAGRRVQFRPRLQEAVAPYVTPATPPVVQLTADEAREALHRDWLFQADGLPTPELIRREIQAAGGLAARLRETASVDRNELSRLDRQAVALAGPSEELYFQVRQLKRRLMLANPAVNFDRLLLVDMPFPAGKEWRHETRHRLGYMAVPGARLLVLEGLAPDGRVRQLMPQAPLDGAFWRPDVSFDGRKVLFCFHPHNEKSFHLYEIAADGSGLVQLTDGPFDDLDPIYLPDGHIVFSTTRGHTYVRCMPPTNAFVLARCDADGRNVYLISANNEPDYLPSMMHDGRVIYTRWEYTDKPLWRAQGLWTVNPDGTQVNTFWGNQSVWPDVLKDARAIPGSRRVMFTGCGHHDWFAGCLGIVDPDRGFNYPEGLKKITAELKWPESGNGPQEAVESEEYRAAGQFAAYYSPYPLSDRDFLVSAQRGDKNAKFLLYLMDVDGNRELIYEGADNVLHAMPLVARPRPPMLPDRIVWPTRPQRREPAEGLLFSANVYQNAPPELRGRARSLRVLSIDHKTYTYWHKRPYLSTGPVVSIVQSEGVKRLLGSVPIQPDGSVALRVPAGIPLHFQLLDADGRALQTMRSFASLMPGEQRGCLGCHESHSRAPLPAGALALRRPPQPITPPPWGQDTVSYPRYVRPVLDAYCSRCHEGEGEGRKALDLTARPGFLDFDEPYMILTGRPSWGKPYEAPNPPVPGFGIADMLMVEAYDKLDPAAYQTPPPMTKLSYRSRLVELCASGRHYGVRVDPLSLQRIAVWVDAMCPYRGDEEVRAEDDPVFQGMDWLAVRPRIKTAPRIIRPGPVD